MQPSPATRAPVPPALLPRLAKERRQSMQRPCFVSTPLIASLSISPSIQWSHRKCCSGCGITIPVHPRSRSFGCPGPPRASRRGSEDSPHLVPAPVPVPLSKPLPKREQSSTGGGGGGGGRGVVTRRRRRLEAAPVVTRRRRRRRRRRPEAAPVVNRRRQRLPLPKPPQLLFLPQRSI